MKWPAWKFIGLNSANDRRRRVSKKAIINGRVIDGTGSKAVAVGTVLVEDKVIQGVGRLDEVPVPSDAERIDAAGKTVMPGIIDSHIHVTPNVDLPSDVRTHLRVGYRAIKTLRDSLRRGVTTVVSITGNPPAVELTKAVEEGLVEGCARQLVAGVVAATEGHVRGGDYPAGHEGWQGRGDGRGPQAVPPPAGLASEEQRQWRVSRAALDGGRQSRRQSLSEASGQHYTYHPGRRPHRGGY